MTALWLLACAAPEAPAELDELTVYLYENHQDDDAMAAGVASLTAWLDAQGELESDYAVSPLSEETVDALDDVDRSVDELMGLAVVTRSTHTVDDAAFAMVGADLVEVYPDLFLNHHVDWVGDPDCFLDRDCPRLEGQEEYDTSLPLGLESHARPYNEYLWSEGEVLAMAQRNWLVEPPTTNSSLLEVEEQFYLNLFADDGQGGFWRLQATWMVYTNNAIDEDIAVGAAGNSMRDNSESLDLFLDER